MRSSGADVVRMVVAGVLGVVLVVVLLSGGVAYEDAAGRASGPNGEVVTVTEYDLLSRADTLEPRPYWVGPRDGVDRFELEGDPEGSIYLRYVKDGGRADEPVADYLTVATYPVSEARAALERSARAQKNGVDDLWVGEGFIALTADDADSAYVVFDDQPEIQVEVYSPRPGAAAALVRSGVLTPLHWVPLG